MIIPINNVLGININTRFIFVNKMFMRCQRDVFRAIKNPRLAGFG